VLYEYVSAFANNGSGFEGLADNTIWWNLSTSLHQANGSLIVQNGEVIGSSLVAQPFIQAKYFQPRPSASNYDPMAMAGGNLARTNPALHEMMDERLNKIVE
jgi:K+-transporting ATPase c subunit